MTSSTNTNSAIGTPLRHESPYVLGLALNTNSYKFSGNFFANHFSMNTFVFKWTKKLQVFKTIVKFILVYVVYYFGGIKNSIKMLAHQKTVFRNITFTIRHWVALFKNKSISIFINCYSPLPVVISRTRIVFSSKNSHYR